MANNFYVQTSGGCQIIIVRGAAADYAGVTHKALRTCALLITIGAGLLKIALALGALS